MKKSLWFISLMTVLSIYIFSCSTETEYVYEESISLKSMPTKTEYFVGDTIDFAGLCITSVAKNGKITEISSEQYAIEPANGAELLEAGEIPVTITFGKRTLSFNIQVHNVENSRLFITSVPKSAYYVGEKLDLSNLKLAILKNDGSTENVESFISEPAEGTVLQKTETGKQSVKISASDLEYNFDISIYEKSLSNIYIKTAAKRTEYFEGEKLDLSNLVIEAAFNDNSTEVISDYTVSPENRSDLNEIGAKTIEISYLDKKTSFEINVKKNIVERIVLKSAPSKTSYYAGENLNLSGLQIEALMSNGTAKIVPADNFTTSVEDGTELSETGKIIIDVEYENKSVDFQISVYDVLLSNLYLKSLPKTMNYYTGDKLNLTGLVLEASFNDGHTEIVKNYICEPSENTSLEKNGSETIKIKYLDKEISFDVSVVNSIFMFTSQPKKSSFPLYSEDQKLSAQVFAEGDGTIVFAWYRKNPNETDFTKFYESEPLEVEFGKIYTTEAILPKNDYVKAEYKCKATITKENSEKSVESDTVVVEQKVETGLASVYIDTNDGSELINKDDKIISTVRILDTDGKELLNDSETTFSGRGNSTWGQAKKPYKIKLSKKASLFGMPKHKQWMLIANYLDMSFMKNEMAFYLSNQLEMDWTIHGKFVNLIKNNQYIGLYWLGEQIKVDENRVNINEENDYLIEMDVYFDENWKFKSAIRNMPYMIKNDDNMKEEKLETLQTKVNAMESVIYDGNFPYTDSSKTTYEQTFNNMIDVDSMAKFYLVNEIMLNGELGHPKSCYFTFDNTNNILKAGPVWDYDWAGASTSTALALKNTIYYDALFKTKEFNDKLNELTQKLTTEGVSNRILELKTEITNGVAFDGIKWGTTNRNPVGDAKTNWNEYVEYLENCINTRLSAIKNMNFETEYRLSQ
ncbi:MAG: bacterial Ig-like domain-containing protein [Treponema sp.]|nr:bacterial Ig-like domain-containing protein [Candidatus Treponema equifaecale]